MTIEAEFLVAAVRRFLTPEAALPDPEKIDWTALLRLAAAHAVTPMLYAALREQSIPEAVQENLRCGLGGSVRRSLARSGEFARVAGLFEERGIPMVALKGPLLSRYLYGDLGARTSGDIDLLAKPKDVARIHDVLISEGYRLTSTLHWSSASACLRWRENEVSLKSPSGVSIDVHWRLVPTYFASAFDELDGGNL